MADLRAPTPSAAAELAVADFRQILQNIAGLRDRMQKAMQRRAELGRAQLMQYQMRFQYLNPEAKLRDNRQRLADLDELLRRAMKNRIAEERHMLGIYLERYRGLSPLYKLKSGIFFCFGQRGKWNYIHKTGTFRRSVGDFCDRWCDRGRSAKQQEGRLE